MGKLKDVKVVLVIVLILTWLLGGAFFYFMHSGNAKKITEKDTKIVELDTQLQQIGELVSVFTVVADVKAGKRIEETDLDYLSVPVNLTSNLIQDESDLVGNYYKVDITPGTPLSTDLITDYELTDDLRLLDVVLHNNPIGLQPDSYVDVRIRLPMGEDFVAISHKQVKAINSGVLKLAVTEQDIHAYNSMLIDSLIYPGTQLYAIEYLEGGVQKPADTYYPISKNVLAIAQKDPNLLTAIKADILQRREALEESLGQVLPDGELGSDIDRILERGRERYSSTLADAERSYQLGVEREEKARQAEERRNR